MIKRTATAIWSGSLKDGKGLVSFGSGEFTGKYSFTSRFEEGEGPGTNPEELIGAAHAGCFSMALAGDLAKNGYEVEEIMTKAIVSLEKLESGYQITGIKLETRAKVEDIEMKDFAEYASGAKKNCPVSKALAAVDVRLEARLAK